MRNLEFVRVDKNGTKIYLDWSCPRCGGRGGSEQWAMTGFTCYECGGSGRSEKARVYKEYTPEYAAKLEARAAARWERQHAEELAREKALAERREAERLAKEAEEAERREAERARKAISQYVGEVGTKLTVDCVYEGSARFEVRDVFGRPETRYVHQFRDGAGNKLVWKTGSGLGGMEEDTLVTVTGTVKAHDEYRDERQTALLRCKIVRRG